MTSTSKDKPMAQELLPLTGGAMTAKQTLDAISPSLARFLMIEATDANDAVARIASRPDLIAEAREQNDLVQRLCAPVGVPGALRALAPLMLMFDRPSFGRGEVGEKLADAWQSTYAQAIAHIPPEALEAAVSQWLKVGRFFPKPAELIALAEPKTVELRKLGWRMKQVVAKAHGPKPPMTDAEKAEVKRLAADLARDLRSGTIFAKKPRYSRPSESQSSMADRLRAMA